MANIQKVLSFLILFALLMSVTGCNLEFSGRTEMNKIEFIRAVGVDKSPDKEDAVRLTIATQSMKPGSGGGGGGQQKKSEILFSEGSTVFEAVRNFWNYMDKRPFWGHLEYIVIGEEAAKEGLLKYIDFFSRDPELRLNSKVYIAKGLNAGEVIKRGNSRDKFVFDRLEGINENQWGQSVSSVVDLMETMYILDNEFLSLYVPSIKLAKFTNGEQDTNETMDIVLGGFALFRGDKLMDYLDDKMGRGLNWLRNKVKSGVIIVKSPKGKDVSLEIIDSNTKLNPEIINGELTVIVKVEMSSNIGEIRSSEDIFIGKTLEDLENQQKQIIKDEIESVIKYAQERGTDFFSTATAVYHKYPIKWEDSYEKNWKETFSDIKFNVIVDSKINRTYDIRQPNRSKVGEDK